MLKLTMNHLVLRQGILSLRVIPCSFVFILILNLCTHDVMAYAPVYTPFDDMSQHMQANRVDPLLLVRQAPHQYFNHAAPNIIHLIDLSMDDSDADAWRQAWTDYGKLFSFSIFHTTKNDLTTTTQYMPDSLKSTFIAAQKRVPITDAENIIKWYSLWLHGGLVIHRNIWPPERQGKMIDLRRLIPMRNFVAVATMLPHHLEMNRSGLTLRDDFMLAAPRHPIIAQLLNSLPANVSALRAEFPQIDSAYTTGNFLLTRSLSGALTVLPNLFLEDFNLVRKVQP